MCVIALRDDNLAVLAVEIGALDRAVVEVGDAHVGPIDMTCLRIHDDAVGEMAIGDDGLAVGAIRDSSSEYGRRSVREGTVGQSGSRPMKPLFAWPEVRSWSVLSCHSCGSIPRMRFALRINPPPASDRPRNVPAGPSSGSCPSRPSAARSRRTRRGEEFCSWRETAGSGRAVRPR